MSGFLRPPVPSFAVVAVQIRDSASGTAASRCGILLGFRGEVRDSDELIRDVAGIVVRDPRSEFAHPENKRDVRRHKRDAQSYLRGRSARRAAARSNHG
jgi:hypothetical protein